MTATAAAAGSVSGQLEYNLPGPNGGINARKLRTNE